MELTTVWFILIAVLWTGYLVLEGFDFGVGMLLGAAARTRRDRERERRVMINTIGPVWDGNEVWLLTAGGATFAAFPEWYATLFSGFYLPLLLILLALIVRVVAFEWRGKIDDDRWRAWADRALIVGSWVPAVLWGVAFANIVRGVELDADHQYVGGFWALLNPFALLGGATTALIFLTHGAIVPGAEVRRRHPRPGRDARGAPRARDPRGRRARGRSGRRSPTRTPRGRGPPSRSPPWRSSRSCVATRARREGLAFVASAVAIVAAVVLIFGSLFPDVMPAFDPANSLTVTNASSTHYTLTVMTWVAVILTPVVLLYQGWTYWVFRKRV